MRVREFDSVRKNESFLILKAFNRSEFESLRVRRVPSSRVRSSEMVES